MLPLGLPWIGARFHLDALAAVFLVVVNLGGAIASLYALGYGRHEAEPERVLPFYPVFLAGMNLVVLAADAFSFLIAWELMSLASWGLVMARHREPGNAQRRLRLPGDGELRRRSACCSPSACWPGRRAPTPSTPCARIRPTRGDRRAWSWRSPSSARDRRRASFRCTSGCRWPTPPRPATCRR